MIKSYQLRIAYCVSESTNWCFSMLVKMILVSITGMLEYKFVMSKARCSVVALGCHVLYQVVGVPCVESIG